MAQLLIASRRSRARPLRSAALAGFVLVVLYGGGSLIFGRLVDYSHPAGKAPSGALRLDPTRPSDGIAYDRGRHYRRGRLQVLELAGSVHDLGVQHGRLLASSAASALRTTRQNVAHTLGDGWFRDLRLRWRWRLLDDGLPGHQLVELAGLARGSGTGYTDLVRQSALFDVVGPSSASAGRDLRALSRSLTIICPVRGTTGDRLVVARSFSMPGLADEGEAIRQTPLLQIVRPEDALAFASVAWPGMTGVVSGINEKGIAVFLHPVRTSDVELTRQAQPTALIARSVLETAETLDEAVSIVKEASSLGSAIFVLVDGKERRWLVLERTPSGSALRPDSDSTTDFVVDLLESKKFRDDALNDRARRTRPDKLRLERARALVGGGTDSIADLVTILRDHGSTDAQRLPVGHRSSLYAPGAVHTALFDVTGRRWERSSTCRRNS